MKHGLVTYFAALYLFSVCAGATATPSPTFHVAPEGNDAWSGRLPVANAQRTDGPLASLPAAVEKARRLPAGQARRIVVGPGDYFLKDGLTLDGRDNGLSLEAATGAPAILHGGRRISGWRPDGDRFWSAPLPEVAAGQWDFRLLVVNDRLCPRARFPKKGTFTHLSSFKVPWMSSTGGGWKRKPTALELTTMIYRPEDLGPWLDVKNAEVTIYHMWDESTVGLAALDPTSHTLTFSSPGGHPPGAFDVKKYVVWNVRQGMTEPGQWYLDRMAGKVVYWPRTNEDMTRAQVFAPTTESVIRLQGNDNRRIKGVTLRGLTVTVTNTPLKAGGFGAHNFAGAIHVENAEDCALLGLRVVRVAGQGIKAQRVQRLRIEDCEIAETGACGLIVHGGQCVIANNHVHHVGRIYPSGIGMTVSARGGSGCRVTHNEIHDTPYSGFTGGGDGLRIEHNLIYRVMQELHDGGAIYLFGKSKGVVLRGNFVRDITDTGGYGASSYYLDELSTDVLVENNLSIGVIRPLLCHMAERNVIRNNVFINEGKINLNFPRSSGHTFQRNIVRAGDTLAIRNLGAVTQAGGNVLFSGTGKVEGYQTQGNLSTSYDHPVVNTLTSDARWTLADPRLLEFKSGKVRFAGDAPPAKQGIAAIDVTDAGRTGAGGKK